METSIQPHPPTDAPPVAGRRPPPRPPGVGLPRFFGLFLTVATVLLLELGFVAGLRMPVPAGILVLVVAVAAYIDGTRPGVIAAALAVSYELYTFLRHGTALVDPSWPSLRVAALGMGTFAVVGLISVFRRQLETLLIQERAMSERAELDRQRAEQGRQELAEALERVERAHEALRLQANLLAAVGQGIIATDAHGRITYWNEPAAALFGRSAAEVATRPITDVMPDSDTGALTTLRRIAQCLPWTGELEVRRADGASFVLLVSDSPIRDATGLCAGMVRVVTDVTAQKDVERTQRLLAESGSALAASLDYEATIRSVTRLCVPGFADGCAVDVVDPDGTAWRLEAAHAHPAVEAQVRGARKAYPLKLESDDPVAAVIRSGLPIFARSVTDAMLAGFAKNGEHYESLRGMGIGSVIVVPLRATGRTLGAMSFWRSPAQTPFRESELLLAEEIATRAGAAIQQARLFETALMASKAKSDFLAVMSHELRTPLTTIVGYTDLMLGGVPQAIPEKARAYIERMRVAASHLLGLIEQILIYARLEAGRERTRPERIDVSTFLRESALLIEPVAQEKGIGFEVEFPPAELTIETDSTKLRQILLNLLSNAVKFTDRGHVRLVANGDDDRVRILVSDTGIGIPEADIERIFDPFWQVDQSPTRRAGGAGLGLAVTRRLVHYLGGELHVTSEEGRGTTFLVELPVRWSEEVAGPDTDRFTVEPDRDKDGTAPAEHALDPPAQRH